MTYLTGKYWDGMHITLKAHLQGLGSACRKRDQLHPWFRDARRFHRFAMAALKVNDLPRARWAAEWLATLVSAGTLETMGRELTPGHPLEQRWQQ